MLIRRREFLKKSGAGMFAIGMLSSQVAKLFAKPLGLPIGAMTFNHRNRINCGDFAGVLRDMKAIGIEQVELCDPWSYVGFQSLADGKAARKVLDDAGIKAASSHVNMTVYRERHKDVLNWAHDLGLVQLSTGDLGQRTKDGRLRLRSGFTTEAFIKEAADEYNQIAAVSKRAGLMQVLHAEPNAAFMNTSRTLDGRNTFPLLIEHLDPALVGIQFQMSAMPTIGSAITYFNLYPGRFWSAHLQGVNAAAGVRPPAAIALPDRNAPQTVPLAPGTGVRLPECSGLEPVAPAAAAQPAAGRAGGAGGGAGGGGGPLAVGEDSVDWPGVFEAAKIGGLKNYFIELPWAQTVKSVEYLKTLA